MLTTTRLHKLLVKFSLHQLDQLLSTHRKYTNTLDLGQCSRFVPSHVNHDKLWTIVHRSHIVRQTNQLSQHREVIIQDRNRVMQFERLL